MASAQVGLPFKTNQSIMAKKIQSKLDPYAEPLAAMEEEIPPKTLAEMQAWLAGQEVAVSVSAIGRFLEARRSERAHERALRLVVNGSKEGKELNRAFAKHPEPQLELIIRLSKVLILQLATEGVADRKLLRLSDRLSRTAIEFIKAGTHARFREIELSHAERRLKISEEKAAAFDQARDVRESTLSPEEQRRRLKEILK